MTDGFDWIGSDDIVIHHQGAIAVYENPHGQIVIRQEGDGTADDAVVVLSKRTASDLIAKLMSYLPPPA